MKVIVNSQINVYIVSLAFGTLCSKTYHASEPLNLGVV